jgi:acyl-CoA dehydrogenase
MVAPTILAHAIDEVREMYLPKLYRGDIVACQLFSEPGAGSDLASMTSRAERDGDEWILNGQKVWTSGAHYSDIGEIICRTDPDLPKHKASPLIVDMCPRASRLAAEADERRRCSTKCSFDDVRIPTRT